jgi:hypothetical protein
MFRLFGNKDRYQRYRTEAVQKFGMNQKVVTFYFNPVGVTIDIGELISIVSNIGNEYGYTLKAQNQTEPNLFGSAFRTLTLTFEKT